MSKKEVRDLQVLENRQLNQTNFLLILKSSENLPELFPGQFVNVDIPDKNDVFLRRPFSVFELDKSENTLSLIIKVLGKGTEKLSGIKAGETLNLVLPLGNGLSIPEKNDNVLLIGGGSGLAPMLFLAKSSNLPPKNVHLLFGARSKEELVEFPEYSAFGRIHYTTEDGSFGEKGYVTQHSVFRNLLQSFSKICACGPQGMMKAVAAEAKIKNIFCEVSLENLMACGFGVCLCCIEPTVKGNLCVCTDGPVFNINDLKW